MPTELQETISPKAEGLDLVALADRVASQYFASKGEEPETLESAADRIARMYHGKIEPMGGGLFKEKPDAETLERIANVEANRYFAKEPAGSLAERGRGRAMFPITEKRPPLVGPPRRLMQPTLSAISPERAYKEEELYAQELEEKRRRPPTERLEYGQLEKIIDVPGQFATQFVDKILFGLPGLAHRLVWKEELPPPKTELAEVTAGAGSLTGMIKGPFHMTGAVFKKIFTKPAKTVAGAALKNIFKQMGTISTASAISEWQGDDAKEVMLSKLEAGKSGAQIGAIFGGAQFAKFVKMSPYLSWMLRAGATSVAIDILHDQNPGDARSTMQKVFDYGLNAWFTRPRATVTPRELMSAETIAGVAKEIKGFNTQMEKEGTPDLKLPETPEEIRGVLQKRVRVEGKKKVTPREKTIAKKYPIINWTRSKGGISLKSLEDLGMKGEAQEIIELQVARKMPQVIFKKKGESADLLSQDAQQNGYIPEADVAKYIEAVTAEARGVPQYGVSERERAGEVERREAEGREEVEMEAQAEVAKEYEEYKKTEIFKKPEKAEEAPVPQKEVTKITKELESLRKKVKITEDSPIEEKVDVLTNAQVDEILRDTGRDPFKFADGTIDYDATKNRLLKLFRKAERGLPKNLRKKLSKYETPEGEVLGEFIGEGYKAKRDLFGELFPGEVSEEGMKTRYAEWMKGEATKVTRVKGRMPNYEEMWYSLERAGVPMRHRAKWIPYIEKNFKPEKFPDVELDTYIVGTKRRMGLSGRMSSEGELLSSEERQWRERRAAVEPEAAEARGERGLTQKLSIPERIFENKEFREAVTRVAKEKKWKDRDLKIIKGVEEQKTDREIAKEVNMTAAWVGKKKNKLFSELRNDEVIQAHYAKEEVRLEKELSKKKVVDDWKKAKQLGLARYMNSGVNMNLSEVIEGMPQVAQDMASKLGTARKDVYKFLAYQTRMPYWHKDMDKPTKFMIDVEGESHRVPEKTFRIAKPFFELRDKKKLFRAMEEIEKVVGTKTESDLTAHDKAAITRQLMILSAEEKKAFKSMRRALDYDVKQYMRRLMLNAGMDKVEIDKFTKEHYRPYYFPHMRFGRFAVFVNKAFTMKDLTDAGMSKKEATQLYRDIRATFGKKRVSGTIEYSAFETDARAKDYRDTILKEFPELKILSKEALDKFVQVVDMKSVNKDPSAFMSILHHLPTVNRLLQTKGGLKDPSLEKLGKVLSVEMYKHFARGRFAHRKLTPGWSKDYEKVLKRYLTTVPFSLAKRYHRPALEKIISEIAPEHQKYASDLRDFWLGEKQFEGALNRGIRRVMYNWFLGLKPSFFVLNLSQRLMTSGPLAIAEGGLVKANNALIEAQVKELALHKDIWSSLWTKDMRTAIKEAKYLSVNEKRVLSRMLEQGELGALRQKEIIGKEKGAILERFGFWSEQSNRIHSALTAIKLGEAKGLKLNELYDYARDFTGKAQFIYSKATRFKWGRGALAPAGVFKSFVFNYFEFNKYLFRENKAAFATSIATFLALGGLLGIPAFKGIAETVVWAGKKAGIIDDEKFMRQQMAEIEQSIEDAKLKGIPVGEMLLHGIPAVLGIEGSWTFGSPELFDLVPTTMYEKGKRLISGLSDKDADWLERAARIAPTEAAHLIRFIQTRYQKKLPVDVYGKPKLTDQDLKHMPKEMRKYAKDVFKHLPKVEDIKELEQVLYAVGFPTRTYTEYGQKVYETKKLAQDVREFKSERHRSIAKTIWNNIESDKLKRYLQRQATTAWFKKNFWSIVNKLDPKDKAKIKSLTKEMKDKKLTVSPQSILYQIKDFE